jgi:hypothetical protein
MCEIFKLRRVMVAAKRPNRRAGGDGGSSGS